VAAKVAPFDGLSQESSQPDVWVQVLQDSKHICSQQIFARCADDERAVRFANIIGRADFLARRLEQVNQFNDDGRD
jgi:hypothetical protein